MWFGSPKNHAEIAIVANTLARHAPGVTLEVVTHFAKPEQETSARRSLDSGGVDWRFTEWSVEAQDAALRSAGIALLPSRNPLSSHNRITSTLLAGAWPVASPVPGFEAFDGHAWLGDIADGLKDYLADPMAKAQLILESQPAIARAFAPESCAKYWDKMLSAL